ncbi:hypothetical protein AAVH_22721 [Aphelenchoides avenae]|nr:hypothetical protein AAVH_22721 [Aphelenchus avenae]
MADIHAYFPYLSSDQAPTSPLTESLSACDETLHGGNTSSKRRKRFHECADCKDLDKMPHSCILKSNQEAQRRSRQRQAHGTNQYDGLLKQFHMANQKALEIGGTASYLLRVLATMTHFCGWKAEAGFGGIPGNLSVQIDDTRDVPLFDSPPNFTSDDSYGEKCAGHIWYKGKKAPCALCEGKPKREWCTACKSLTKNKSTADCRRNKKEEALRRENLQSQLKGTQTTLATQRRLCRCVINVIRDMAWCPRCAQSSDVGCESYGQSILSCTEN